jgi:hypothetical protein
VEIGPAYRAGAHAKKNLTGGGIGHRHVRRAQCLAGFFKEHGAHWFNLYRKSFEKPNPPAQQLVFSSGFVVVL